MDPETAPMRLDWVLRTMWWAQLVATPLTIGSAALGFTVMCRSTTFYLAHVLALSLAVAAPLAVAVGIPLRWLATARGWVRDKWTPTGGEVLLAVSAGVTQFIANGVAAMLVVVPMLVPCPTALWMALLLIPACVVELWALWMAWWHMRWPLSRTAWRPRALGSK